jgi:leucine dehydrogenase
MTIEDKIANLDIFDYASSHSTEEIHFKIDKKSGMRAIIVINSTKRGPALGGCRFIEYPDNFSAIKDAVRLAEGMSYKAALAGLELGGGKSVIIKPSKSFDRREYMASFGKFVNDLNGRYITALDSGTELNDMDIMGQHTTYLSSNSIFGDPSKHTALGIFKGIEAAVEIKLGKKSVNGLHIAIQGLGHVGFLLAEILYNNGAKLTVTDINPKNVEKATSLLNAKFVETHNIHKVECDVFSPCALGAILNSQTISELNTTIVAGAANNQLEHKYHGDMIHNRGILYAPDYVINSGGLIFAAGQYFNHSDKEKEDKINKIKDTLLNIFQKSIYENIPSSHIADKIAKELLD